MNTIKWELEDLSFAALYPKVYEEIVRMVGDRTPEREKSLSVIRNQIADDLRTARIKATITGRPKHYYSIYQKMIVRDKDFDDINDLMGVRVLVDSVRDCYAALGTLHSRWNPLPGRFKDYIAMPKFNMYQSLHTTVIGPGGKPVEIQIRTHEMHRRAEYGVAAHWKYKDQPNRTATGPGSPRDGDMGWLRSLVDWQQETSDPGEFLDSLRFEINAREVFVFTPKGEVMALPAGSTPVDFAYAVHTEVGHRTIGARVNGKLVPLNSELNHGDWVEIFTSKAEGRRAQPGLAALRQERPRTEQDPPVVQQGTPRRGDRPRQGAADPRHAEAEPAAAAPDDARRPGRRGRGLQVRRHLRPVRRRGRRPHVSAVRHGKARREPRRQRKHPTTTSPKSASPRRSAKARFSDSGVVVRGVGDVWVKLARCCTPVPPDPILGFVTRGSGVSVHRTDCTNISGPQGPAGQDRGRGLGADAVERVPGGDPGGGAGPEVAALGRDAGPLREPREHPGRQCAHVHATGWPSQGLPSRWATPSTSATSSAPSGGSTACSTSTGPPATSGGASSASFSRAAFLCGSRGRGFDGQDQQAEPDVEFRAGQQPRQGRNGPLGVHVQGDVQGGAQRARDHQPAQADDVEGAEPDLMERAAPGGRGGWKCGVWHPPAGPAGPARAAQP